MDPFRQPTSIGRYRVLGRLGKGAMGVVFSARDERLGRDVAIKVMNAGFDDEPDTRARFVREAQVTSKLLHRNIVTVFDIDEDAGRPFIVMELLKGKTLQQALKDPQLATLETRLDLMIQLCEGLSKAHLAGVIHRDIKPSNLFILPDGSLKILDFGIARLASSSMTGTGLVVGTPDYMSPEQARGGEVDERADIFSTAAVFYFMLTGRRPFAGPDVATSLRRVMQEEPDPLSANEAPEPLARIVAKALQKDPAQRYQRCVDMAADLIRFRRNFDTETRHLGTSTRAQFDEAMRLARELRTLQQDAGEPPLEWVESLSRALAARSPFLAGDTNMAPVTVPLPRAHVAEITAEIGSAINRFSQEVKRITTERAERARRIDDLFEQAERTIQSGVIDQGDALLDEAGRAGMDPERLQYLAALVVDARFVEGALATSRAQCANGAWDEAIGGLQMILERRPDYTTLQGELVRIQAEHARLLELGALQREAAQRERQAAERAVDAERLLNLGDCNGAVRLAEEALAILPDQADALRVRTEAVRLLEQEAAAAIVTARARHHMVRAVKHVAAGRFDDAVRESQAAMELTPDAERAKTVHAEAARLRDANETSRQRTLDLQAREQTIARLVTQARSDLAAGAHAPALRAAEEAVALDAIHGAAQLALDQVRTVIALVASDDEDTVTLKPTPPPQGDTIAGLVGQAGEVVKDVGRRLADRIKSLRG